MLGGCGGYDTSDTATTGIQNYQGKLSIQLKLYSVIMRTMVPL